MSDVNRAGFAGTQSLFKLHCLVWTGLLAALIAVGAYAHFPIGPVPISLQVCFVLLAGFVLGPVWGFSAVALYVLAGLAGLPVFSGGTSGMGHVLGPTGGYLLGFLAAPLITGAGLRLVPRRVLPLGWGLFLAVLGYVPIYGLGLTWLKTSLAISWGKAVWVGMLPFLPSDLLQVAISVAAARYLFNHDLTPIR
ncbi:MAG: biotin transporter BioY [Desulfohalobiaceae bacterium]|nr:biotin transporter BioY [Desulfohalobiaceae bacterium]